MKPLLRRLRRGVLPVRNMLGPIGTATVVAEGVALTALHVVVSEDPRQLRVGADPGLPVRAIRTLPLTGFHEVYRQARRSQQRNEQLAGAYVSLDTVDLALLAVPGLHCHALLPRGAPVTIGEPIVVASYPGGRWHLTQGPVIGVDQADFAVRLLVGPGASGAPALDHEARLVGLVTLDHGSATVCIGPTLIWTFLHTLMAGDSAVVTRRRVHPGDHSRA